MSEIGLFGENINNQRRNCWDTCTIVVNGDYACMCRVYCRCCCGHLKKNIKAGIKVSNFVEIGVDEDLKMYE
jgi:hypothetical protein